MTPPSHGSRPLDRVERGVLLLERGHPRQALIQFREVLSSHPDHGLAHYNSGVAYHALEDYANAAACYLEAIERLPNLNAAYHNLGQAFTRLSRPTEAVPVYEKALELDPDDFNSAHNLSLLYRKLGRDQAAIDAIHTAIRARPDSAEAFCILGMLHHESDRFDEAMVSLEQALRIHPDYPEAHYHKGIVHQKTDRFESALRAYQKAMASDPEFAPAHWLYHLSLPMIYDSPDHLDTCRRDFKIRLNRLIESIQLDDDRGKAFALRGIQTTTNFFLHYQCRDDVTIQKRYGQLVHRVMAANYPQWPAKNTMPPIPEDGRIRIGYVSSLMYHHTVGTFLSGWLESHTPDLFDISCYHVGRRTDDFTHRLKDLSNRFHYFAGNLEAAIRQIASDDLHILVYTDIGMDPITAQLAALRLAPVQCKGWGQPVTTGLPTIDYYLSSDLMEPPNADAFYSEVLVRLPNLALCYRPPTLPEPPKTRSELGLPDDRFIYLSTQSIFKYLPQHDDIYPKIAREVPGALFVFLKNQSEFATARFRRRLQSAFARFDLDADTFCHFSNRLNFNDFLSLNLAADVVLDSLEWSGGKTTLEALSCGLPVVTLPGRLMRGRHAYAMLRKMDVAETIAVDKAMYCGIAVRLATDPMFKAHVRARIARNRFRLYQDREFMQALERFYRDRVISP